MRKHNIILFGGTSEGRELAEYGAKVHASLLVSVVSEYGEMLLPENEWVSVRTGALEPEEMEQLFIREQPKLVLDATHPYAVEVTRSLRQVCERRNIPYRRVLRASSRLEGRTVEGRASVFYADSVKQAVQLLKQDDRPVFLTTGSKELKEFAMAGHLQGRLYARVLPDSQVIASCQELGIQGKHLIAMQGPFSRELNRAMLRQTGAGWLVTKESGARGGFEEKLEAARDCGTSVIVIGRPSWEDGITLQEAKKEIHVFGSRFSSGIETEKEKTRQLFLIGLGMGGGRQLTLEAAEALTQCDGVLGASRMLKDAAPWIQGALQAPFYQPDQILEWAKAHPKLERIGVLYSGDTGFYSGCQSLLNRLQGDSLWSVRIYPGISSVSGLCARMGISWEHMYLASAHGRECDVAELIQKHEQVFVLLGGELGLKEVCRRLTEAGYGQVQVAAGIRIGYADEQLIQDRAACLTEAEVPGLAAVLFTRNERMENRS